MPQKNREELKVYYEDGSAPVQGQHEDLIDSFLNIVDDSAAIIQPSPLGKTLFVDANASGAGLRGNVYQPYKDPNQALTDAIIGDTIIILPGEYLCTNLYKPGVNYYAFPGVVITHEDNLSALFDDIDNGIGNLNFKGHAKFIEKSTWINNTLGSTINITAANLNVQSESNNSIMGSGLGIVSVNIKSIVFSSVNSFILVNGLEVNMKSDRVIIETVDYDTNFIALAGSENVCSVEIRALYADTYNALEGNSFLFFISPSSVFRIKKTKINTSASKIINGIGIVLLDRLKIVMTNEQAIAFVTSENTTIKNTDVYHVSPSSNTYCISGSQVEIIGVLNSNMPVAYTNISLITGEFNYDTNFIII